MVPISVFVVAQTSLRSPWKLVSFIIKRVYLQHQSIPITFYLILKTLCHSLVPIPARMLRGRNRVARIRTNCPWAAEWSAFRAPWCKYLRSILVSEAVEPNTTGSHTPTASEHTFTIKGTCWSDTWNLRTLWTQRKKYTICKVSASLKLLSQTQPGIAHLHLVNGTLITVTCSSDILMLPTYLNISKEIRTSWVKVLAL